MTVTLREVLPEDLPVLYEHQADPASAEMAGIPTRDRARFDEHWTRLLSDPALIKLAVLEDGALAGNLVSWPDADGVRLVGYWIERARWGRGIASAALAAFLEREDRRPLRAITTPENAASQRVLQRNGFVRDGECDDGALVFTLA